MPELPEVETLRRALAPSLVGARLAQVQVRCPALRNPIDAAGLQKLEGKKLEELSRRGKFLLFHFADDVLVCHLGMSGRLLLRNSQAPWPDHVHVVFGFEPFGELAFRDPRRFGTLLLVPTQALTHHPILARLGPEPLSPKAVEHALRAVRNRRRAIRDLLLDQQVIAGVGNIYACEALFAARIHPAAKAWKLADEQFALLARALVRVLTRAIRAGGTTLRDGAWRGAFGEPGFFSQKLSVYGREGQPCRRCGTLIVRLPLCGRSAYHCPRCQR